MPAWLASALIAARGLLFGTPVRAGATGLGGGLALGDGIPDVGLGLPGLGLLGGEEKPKRRRRRRALTKSDMVDLAFLASIVSKAGVERAAALMIARS